MSIHTHLVHCIPPELQFEARLLGPAITIGLFALLTGDRPDYAGDFELTRESVVLGHIQTCANAELLAALDKLIITETETIGDMIVISRLFQWRLREWPPEVCERWADALVKYKHIAAGRRAALVEDPYWPEFRRLTIAEIKASGNLLVAEITRCRSSVTRRELAAAWERVIDSHPEDFGHLRRNRSSWLGFVGSEGDKVRSNELNCLRRGESFSAPTLFDEWQGYRLRRDPEKLRQKISGLKPH